jgi:hypothetical protein
MVPHFPAGSNSDIRTTFNINTALYSFAVSLGMDQCQEGGSIIGF